MATRMEEGLRQLDSRALDVQEIPVVQGLQPEVAELEIARRIEGGT